MPRPSVTSATPVCTRTTACPSCTLSELLDDTLCRAVRLDGWYTKGEGVSTTCWCLEVLVGPCGLLLLLLPRLTSDSDVAQ